MTQQPFYPQQPGYPQQGYPAQPQYPVAPQQPFPPQGYAPQQYAAPAQPPAVPLAQGTLDDFYNQPTTGGGPSISWKDKPIGTTYVGIVARDVTNGDVQQQVNFQSKQPEFYRDGRPKFVLKVPLKQIAVLQNGQAFQAPEFAENGGEGTYFVRGQARDELARAMSEANVQGAPRAGDVIQVTLVQRKPSGQGMNPSNIVQIRYVPAVAGTGAPSPAPESLPTQQAAPAQPQIQQQAPVQPQQAAPVPMPGYPGVADGQFQQQAPVQQPQIQQQQAPAQPVQPQGQMQMPEGLSPEQQALFARITSGNAA